MSRHSRRPPRPQHVARESYHFRAVRVDANVARGHFFFFNDPGTTEIYTLSLHDALPICHGAGFRQSRVQRFGGAPAGASDRRPPPDGGRDRGDPAADRRAAVSAAHWLGNLAAWSAQAVALIAAGSVAAWAFQLRVP